MEPNNVEEEKPRPVKLETEVKNSIRHTFEALQNSNGRNSLAGEVAKSKLQVLCATISRDLGVAYSADDLNLNFKEDKKSLSCVEFVEYLEEHLLPKGSENLDLQKLQKLHKLCWSIVSQAFFKKEDHTLIEDDVYKQWLIFNTLDIDETSRVHKEELGLLLEKVSHAIGKIWNPALLNESFDDVEELMFWQYLECLEKSYLAGTTRSVFQEALEEIVDYVVNEILMQGYLIKKGHMVRSVKNRWFVLKPGLLSYYTNRACSDKKGEIVINQDTKVAAVPDSKKYRFSITCGKSKTNYDLEARDQRTKQEWLVAVQKAIENSGGQSVQRKERLQRRLERNDRRLAKLEEERKKREQEKLLLEQQKELELLRQKYSDAEAQALLEAENLQEEIRRREELEKLHLELQQLLLAEKEAREAEAKARALQEELLANEKKRLEEMERMKLEKEQLLQDELKMRESLEERQKLQDKLLEEERQRLETLEKERQAAEQAMKEANDKLEAAREASRKAAEEAKKKAREIKTCTGLARPVGPHNPSFITHRGIGAFCEEDFSKIIKRQKIPPSVLPKPKRQVANGEAQENGADENDSSGQAGGGEEDENRSKNVDVEIQEEIPEQNDKQAKELSSDEPVNNGEETPEINGKDDVENSKEEVVAERESTENVPSKKSEENIEVAEGVGEATPQDHAIESSEAKQASEKAPKDEESEETPQASEETQQDSQDNEVTLQENRNESSPEEQETQACEGTPQDVQANEATPQGNATDSEVTPQENTNESAEQEQETQASEGTPQDLEAREVTPQENTTECPETEEPETQFSEAKTEGQTDEDTANNVEGGEIEKSTDEETTKEHDEPTKTEESKTADES